MAGTVSLLEMGKGARNEATRNFVETFRGKSDLMEAIKVSSDGVSNGAYRYDIEATLPGIAFRGMNEGYTASAGVINPKVEALYIVGGEVKIDQKEVKWKGQGWRAKKIMSKQKALAISVADKIIKGDNTSDRREPDGLQRRLPLTGSQTISNSASSGGAALKLNKLLEAIDAVQGATHLLMNPTMRRHLTMAHSDTGVSGYLGQTTDSWGRIQKTFGGLPILIGYEAGPNTAILPFTEAFAGGGSAAGTSIYVLNLSAEDGVTFLQDGPPEVDDFGKMETEPTYMWRADWGIGMAIENPYSISRLSSVTNAAMTRT